MYTYEEVIEQIDCAHRFGKQPGVEVMQIVLRELGNPGKGIPFIHVAGTNGKGSTCAYLDAALQELGYLVGRFTSPHLVEFEERITVNGKQISKQDVARIGSMLLEKDFGIELTYFDYCLAMALVYFCEQQCEVLVIETGLGGTLDSTNAIGVPEVSVITKIGFDHTAILGNTLTKIATEKAGIIKPGSSLVFQRQEEEAQKVLLQVAQRVGTRELFWVTTQDCEAMSKLALPLVGVHQRENAAAAKIAALLFWKRTAGEEKLRSEEQIQNLILRGILKTKWPGRMEILSEEPFFMVDGAHNGHGVSALAASLREWYPEEKFHFIMGVMADKDYEEMIEKLLPLALDFCTVTPESTRALQADKLAACIRKEGIPVSCVDRMEDIFSRIKDTHFKEKTIAFGSLYFVGEIKKLAAQRR